MSLTEKKTIDGRNVLLLLANDVAVRLCNKCSRLSAAQTYAVTSRYMPQTRNTIHDKDGSLFTLPACGAERAHPGSMISGGLKPQITHRKQFLRQAHLVLPAHYKGRTKGPVFHGRACLPCNPAEEARSVLYVI